ncbi:MAG: hypothetical protein NTY07_06920 [Bacteroidia bacterium]|nr:hypothetical protein [Bacteroidia bacterium]
MAEGKEPELPEFLLLGLGLAFLFAGPFVGGLSLSVFQRLKYIESDDIKIPDFHDKQERIIKLKNQNFSFEDLQGKIAQKWILTHVDNYRKIVKFKTKVTLFSWGIGGYVAFDSAGNTILLVSFPFIGYTQKGRRLKTALNNQVEGMILNT